MKKIFLAVMITLMTVSVFAESKESEYYYINIPVEKIYPHREGYVVQYRKGLYGVAQLYLPLDWFSTPGDKGELVYLRGGKTWPSLSVYYKEGVFSHCKLYVRSRPHETWGNNLLGANVEGRFEGIEDVKVEF
jgi:hypothetical protein